MFQLYKKYNKSKVFIYKYIHLYKYIHRAKILYYAYMPLLLDIVMNPITCNYINILNYSGL